MTLFPCNDEVPRNMLPRDGEAYYYPSFFSMEESERLFKSLMETTEWQQEKLKFFGKEVELPRLTSLYGEPGKIYQYSGIKMNPHPWSKTLLEIKSRIEPLAKVQFSVVLINLYRTGKDSNDWHADDEKELGKNPVIGSVSFGAPRIFKFRHANEKGLSRKTELQGGSFLLMKGTTQHYWQHQIPKTARPVSKRINLTFRVIG